MATVVVYPPGTPAAGVYPAGYSPAAGMYPAGYSPAAAGGGAAAMPAPAPIPVPIVTVPHAPGGPDLLHTLSACKGLFIAQRMNILEVLTGCEVANRYVATAWDPLLGVESPSSGKLGGDMVEFRERSNCLVRQCLGPRRPFHMGAVPVSSTIRTAMPQGGDALSYPDGLVLERPFKCTALCLWRPIVRVRHNTLGYLGEIFNPFTLCEIQLVIRSPAAEAEGPVYNPGKLAPNTPWYTIAGSIWQAGLFCGVLPCGPCKKISFHIFAGTDTKSTPVGEVQRIWPGCVKSALSDTDTYTVRFPEAADPIQRALIMSAVLLLDYLYFERPKKRHSAGIIDAAT